MTHQASLPPPELPQTIQPGALHYLGAAHYLDLSELPACLSVRVSVSIRADDLTTPEEAPSAELPSIRRPAKPRC